MSEEAMHAGVEVKVEDYDGSYDCLFCGDSVRGMPALVCWECNSNPWHRACDKESKYLEVCPTCNQKSVTVWTGASAGPGGQSEFIDLTGEGGGAAEVATLTGHGAREDAVSAVGGGLGAWGDGAATSAGAGALGGGSKGKGRADNGSARARNGGESGGGVSGKAWTGHSSAGEIRV